MAQAATLIGRFGALLSVGSARGPARAEEPVPHGAPSAEMLVGNYEALGLGWFWATDAEGRISYVSEGMRAAIGLSDEGPGCKLAEAFVSGDEDEPRSLPFQLARRNRFEGLAVRLRRSTASAEGEDAANRWWALSGRAQFDEAGQFTGFIGHGIDITSERVSAEASNRLAMYDPLTGLLNRRHMAQFLDAALAMSRAASRPCALLQIDLDRFKQVNDTLGHPVGDGLLKQVAERLQALVGDNAKVCRIGGDEFQIAVQDQDDRGVLGELGAGIVTALSEPFNVGGARCSIGASVGIAVSPYDGDQPEDLIRNADLALYAAKGAGRGRFCFYSRYLSDAADDRQKLEQDLRGAVAAGQIELAYQPIVNVADNSVALFEARIAWNHPQLGLLASTAFLPIAEEARLIAQIGEWTLRQACEEAACWPRSLRVAVNVSAVQFAEDGFVATVASALAHSSLDPDRLELEITEKVFLSESEDSAAKFAALKGLGVRLVLDDFGSGHSSLGYLRTAPFDKIKIDHSFIRGATAQEARNRALIAAIVALAEALGMETTADGIESFDQLEMVRSLRVSLAQGTLFSDPVPVDCIAEQLGQDQWFIPPAGPARQRAPRFAVLRKIGVIHEDFRYSVLMRNISESGALIEGLLDVPVGTQFVLDLGDGQLAVATVRRATRDQQGVEFEQKLISDGQGGLCTRNRVSPYAIAAVEGSTCGAIPMFCTRDDWAD